ncbi:unnamed protein product [Phyllotreta striolata]|uniref:Uncharacterized protein n=1 Tax=Phyllotreta striolata TaxID=444603 RepID=A0A9N9TDP0_PHYSR|nr:unnamed protein product [Phyllotreta striolata]
MKYLVVLVVVCVCYVQSEFTPEQVAKIKQHHAECSKESGVNQELVARARKGDFVEDAKLKRHMFCVSKKIGFQNQEGMVQEEVLKAKVGAILGDQKLADSLIGVCAKNLANGEETAFAAVKCYYEKTPTHISIV